MSLHSYTRRFAFWVWLTEIRILWIIRISAFLGFQYAFQRIPFLVADCGCFVSVVSNYFSFSGLNREEAYIDPSGSLFRKLGTVSRFEFPILLLFSPWLYENINFSPPDTVVKKRTFLYVNWGVFNILAVIHARKKNMPS